MATLFKTTAAIAKDASSGVVTIPTNGRRIVAMGLKIPTVTGAITAKLRHVDTDNTGLYVWAPAGISSKTAGNYFTYTAEESAAPKPLEGVPTTDAGVECELTSAGTEAAARSFVVWVWML